MALATRLRGQPKWAMNNPFGRAKVAQIITTHSSGTVAVTPSPMATASGKGQAACNP